MPNTVSPRCRRPALVLALTLLGLGGSGAACVPAGRYRAQLAEAERLRAQLEAGREEEQRLLNALATLESAQEALEAERAEAAQEAELLSLDLRASEADRRELEEHAQQLEQRERELSTLHDQMSELWYRQALTRARRGSAPPPLSPPQEAGAVGQP
ncbi:hypothetical protein FGE12_14785 [Aggregicoccus sp. 17bor-14]|uniref:hypothetical protein n=1 Tax=Myxococcaceae TaxID=31 RepID=UPI00129D12B6|nr:MULTISPECIES: hypothetical protein [Myxococcaceae]MBF5043659.1 hypothetical protein [Simulacricoccus sp. 17bor-14]MRI89417.1 hypothetical protein [Aggregicoccus sp. 17bor-14]